MIFGFIEFVVIVYQSYCGWSFSPDGFNVSCEKDLCEFNLKCSDAGGGKHKLDYSGV